MDIDIIIKCITAIFLILGAADYALGNRFGLGSEFEKGLMTSGRLFLCMAGFIILSPVIAHVLTPIVTPLFELVGADPSMIAGMILANDAGGAPLALEMAKKPEAGLYSGQIVGAMMGTSVMLTIPFLMQQINKENAQSIVYGLLCGICTIPMGCMVGGIFAGYDLNMLFRNTIPILIIDVLLLAGLIWFKKLIMPVFSVLGKILTALSCAGLVLGGISQLAGVELISGCTPLTEVFTVVGGITVFLAGIFPLTEVLRRICKTPLDKIGNRLGINQTSVSGLLLTLANCIPTFGLLSKMDKRGQMLNVAFIVSASCTFGDHLAYVTQTNPELTAALLLGKLTGGITAFITANLLYSKLKQE